MPRGRKRLYPDEEMFEAMRAVATDGKLKHDDYLASGRLPSAGAICKRFGGWNKALESAGLRASYPGQRKYAEEEMLEALREEAARLGKDTITISEYRETGRRPSSGGIYFRFGSWPLALKAAGLRVPLKATLEEAPSARRRKEKRERITQASLDPSPEKPASKPYLGRKKKLESLGPPVKAKPTEEKPCMRCSKTIKSQGPQHRHCEPCRLALERGAPQRGWHRGISPKSLGRTPAQPTGEERREMVARARKGEKVEELERAGCRVLGGEELEAFSKEHKRPKKLWQSPYGKEVKSLGGVQ